MAKICKLLVLEVLGKVGSCLKAEGLNHSTTLSCSPSTVAASQLLHTSFLVSSMAILRSNYTNGLPTDIRGVIKTRAWKGLSAWAQRKHTQWFTLFLQRPEPDSTLFISADWLFSAPNYFTNGSEVLLYSTFQKILKIKQNSTQTHLFLLKASPQNSAKLWSKISLAFTVQQKKWNI